MADSKRWQATLAEHRTAWIIATLSLLIVLIAILQPEWLSRITTNEQAPTEQAAVETPAKANPHKYSPIIQPKKASKTTATATSSQVAPASNLPGYATRPLAKAPAPVLPEAKTSDDRTTSAATASQTTGKQIIQPQHTAPVTKKASKKVYGHYYVQIGAFSNKSHADKLAARINRNNWSAKVVKKTAKLFAVWVGPRGTRSLANALKSSLQQRLNMKGFIIKQP